MRTAEQNRGAQIAYDTAYFVLPHRAHADLKELVADFADSPDQAALFYFRLSAKARAVEPSTEDLRALRGHTGRLDAARDYLIVEYPKFPAVDLLANESERLPLVSGYVLAPYFSAVIYNRDLYDVMYFVLGQSPDAQTTLRTVSPALNANLGRGCEPELGAFLELLRARTANRSE